MTRNASNLIAATSSRSAPATPESRQVGEADEAASRERDRIAEAYLGRWGSEATQQRTRGRVDWMAASAQGPRILDIGCSEGILALLLARAGHQVVGIDIEPGAIAAAYDLVRSEPSAVRGRIDLQVADALSVDLGENRFDTVVLGEVIEHLEEPSSMLERAAVFLKPAGRLVLTTPFGHFPHPDHRHEFRTTELVRLLSARFVIDELTVVDGFFRVSARAMTAPILQERRAPEPYQLLLTTEEAAISAQKHLHNQLALRAEKERVLAEKVRRLGRQLEHQKRITAVVHTRMQQAQVRLKQQRKSLQRELGRAVEKSLGSPLGIFRLPSRIAKAYRRARQGADVHERGAASEREAPRPASAPDPAHEMPAVASTKTRSSARRDIPHRDLSNVFPPYPFPTLPPRTSVRMATILDEFSDFCFRYEANLVRLTIKGWRKQIEEHRPQLLFVESAWRGNRGNWAGLITDAGRTRDNPLDTLVSYCKDHGIPTVFWNKEDPPNFESFIDAAAKFDHVFTTDANCIERYHTRLGHQRVAALPFAVQPAIHNPIGKLESDDHEIAFAGTWYGQKHVERGALLPILLDAAMEYNLHIFDRMSGHTRDDTYQFPDKYAAFLRKSLPYPNVLSAYRKFKVFLNVNSVTDSPTMFARRVFEILASSTAVVSTASAGIEQMLGDVVSIVHDEEEARLELDRLLADPAYRQRKTHAGYRKVTRGHTYAARFRTITRAIGCDLDDVSGSPKVSVIIPLSDEQWLDNALANVRRQRYAHIETLWVLKDGAASGLAERIMGDHRRPRIVEVGADAPLAAMLRHGIEAARGPLITAFEPRDVYGPEFIGDLVLALTYADADIAGKAAYFTAAPGGHTPVLHQPASRYRHVDRLIGTAWLARRTLFQRTDIDQMLRIEDGRPMLACANGSGRMYGSDPYNYLRFEDASVTPAAIAARLDQHGSLGIASAEVMI